MRDPIAVEASTGEAMLPCWCKGACYPFLALNADLRVTNTHVADIAANIIIYPKEQE